MPEQQCWSVGRRGVSLKVRAKPGARRDAIVGVRAGELVVEVRAAPEKGKANGEIARLLAEALGLTRQEVTLAFGGAGHHKVFLLPASAQNALRSKEVPWT